MVILAVASETERTTESSQIRVSAESEPPELGIQAPAEVSAVIYPFQSATIGTEVRGFVDLINYKEGEAVANGAVVAEVSKDRYQSVLKEFQGNLNVVLRSLERAKEEYRVQDELYEKRATTYHDLLKARYELKVLEAQQEQAEGKLKQAELNLNACVLKAPFSGEIAVLYHNPFEAVDSLEKVFELVDTNKVYARANWPESRLGEVVLGRKAVFIYNGQKHEGFIEKISPLIDPASKSKRISVLIDNKDRKLQIGMSGTLIIAKPEK
jgi:RND family efflux transporter MFP subunit